MTDSHERIGLVGDKILGAKPEMIEFSPSGRHLVAFAKGVLHVFELDEANAIPDVGIGNGAAAADAP